MKITPMNPILAAIKANFLSRSAYIALKPISHTKRVRHSRKKRRFSFARKFLKRTKIPVEIIIKLLNRGGRN
ncbi:MAG: hypothetical protein DRP68_07145 [Candidatus Omnitrophota bacterium]|nr:MAG: hypothetical protein DRP68_07145 [Candidatus Omnitrophota bacterium]RKY36566.1 MAG: hypothetical protein DRP72_03975 [Candidatus Omnitrophota bacterium]